MSVGIQESWRAVLSHWATVPLPAEATPDVLMELAEGLVEEERLRRIRSAEGGQ